MAIHLIFLFTFKSLTGMCKLRVGLRFLWISDSICLNGEKEMPQKFDVYSDPFSPYILFYFYRSETYKVVWYELSASNILIFYKIKKKFKKNLKNIPFRFFSYLHPGNFCFYSTTVITSIIKSLVKIRKIAKSNDMR